MLSHVSTKTKCTPYKEYVIVIYLDPVVLDLEHHLLAHHMMGHYISIPVVGELAVLGDRSEHLIGTGAGA